MNDMRCKIPPRGWRCTRGSGHPGPCAAYPSHLSEDEIVALTKKYANRSGGGHFQLTWHQQPWPWCCERCQTLYDAISEACQLSQRVAIPSEKDDALLNVLTRYEGAVGDVERDGDTSDEAIKELAQARAELMRLLRAAKEIEEKS